MFYYFQVGITWEDAPEDQYAVIHKDSKIRCVVKARPAAIVDWLKESLIISTGKFFYFYIDFYDFSYQLIQIYRYVEYPI